MGTFTSNTWDSLLNTFEHSNCNATMAHYKLTPENYVMNLYVYVSNGFLMSTVCSLCCILVCLVYYVNRPGEYEEHDKAVIAETNLDEKLKIQNNDNDSNEVKAFVTSRFDENVGNFINKSQKRIYAFGISLKVSRCRRFFCFRQQQKKLPHPVP